MTKVQIYLNSKYATLKNNGTAKSDLIFYFTSPIVPPQGSNMTLRVLNCSIPVSYSNINTSNNTLVIDSTTYTITTGTYNALTLKTELSALLGTNYTVAYDAVTNKFSFTSLTNFTISKTSTCLKLLGFADGTDTTSTDSVLESSYPIDLSGDNTVYVDIANFTTNNLSSSVGGRTSIVKSILMNVPYGSVLFHEDGNENSALTIQEDHISFVHVRLLGEDATTLLDLNNADWQMTLEVGFVKKETQPVLANSFQDLYRAYIDKLREPTQ